MKKLTWRFKRSRLFEQDLLGTHLILTCHLLMSCQVHHGNGQPQSASQADAIQSSAKRSASKRLGADWTTASYPFRLLAKSNNPGQAPTPIADLLAEECDAESGSRLHLRVRLQSDFGEHLIRLTLSRPHEQVTAAAPQLTASTNLQAHALPTETIEAEADGQLMHLQPTQPLYAQLHKQTCQHNGSDIIVETETATTIQTLLKRLSPDCESLDFATLGFSCRLPATDPSRVQHELEALQTTMIRTWSRQPYLVARRLAVALRLAEALQAPKPELHLQTFCKVLKHSLPNELPATLISSRWQQAVCNASTQTATQRQAAAFGLTKAAAEIEFLRQIFERTSKLGILTLHLPEFAVANSEIWVSLNPEPDVAERMVKETAKIWLNENKVSDIPPIDLPGACWHPVFSENPKLIMLARHLTLAGESDAIECRSSHDQDNTTTELVRYVANSITSETEFMLSNRKSKTLRLPVGTYHYELRGMPDDPSEWDDAAQAETRTAGRIIWDEKRPRPVISVW